MFRIKTFKNYLRSYPAQITVGTQKEWQAAMVQYTLKRITSISPPSIESILKNLKSESLSLEEQFKVCF